MSYFSGIKPLFSIEERELIACGFKNQLKELRTSIKDINIISSKDKYSTKKAMMSRYKDGLVKEMI